jgi:hypothetical protein
MQGIFRRSSAAGLPPLWLTESRLSFGWLLDYPEHPTQGIDIPDLEKHLLEIYGWIKDGTLDVTEHYGTLEVV